MKRTNAASARRAVPLDPRAWRRCGPGATPPPRPSPGTSGSGAGTARTPRTRPARRRRRRASRCRSRISGRRPGLRRPCRVEASLSRAVQVGDGRVDRPRRLRIGSSVHDADADLGHEPPPVEARASVAGSASTPGAGRQRAAGRRPRRRPGAAAAWAATSSGWPSSSTQVGRAVPQHRTPAGGACRDERERVDRRRRTTATARARGRVRRITSPMNASVPSEPTSSRHRSKPLTFFTVGPPALTSAPSAESRTRRLSSASRTGP